jgi:hypothetical protein
MTTTASTTQSTTTQAPVSCLLDIPYSNKQPDGCAAKHVNWKGASVTRTSFRGKDSRILRFAVNNNEGAFDADYTGFLGFSKTKCGIDFVNASIDGRLALSLADYEADYEIMYQHKRINGKQTSSITQFYRTKGTGGDLGNNKKDLVYLMIQGLDNIDFGDLDMDFCLERVVVGIMPATTEDHTACAAWDKDLGY